MHVIRRRLVNTISAILVTLAFGTVGFKLIERQYSVFDAFYMTLTTITTVGYGEIHPLSHAGRIFNSFLIFFGVTVMLLAIGAMTQTVIELELNQYFGKRRIRKMIDKLQDHFIVCGYGRVGRGAAQGLRNAGVPFLVVDRDEDLVERAIHAGMLAVLADCTRDDTLIECGIERAKGKTFRWGGQYLDNLNEAKTDFTELNVFQSFQPRIPKEYEDTQFLFLANIQPTLQADVRRKLKGVRLTGCDTMNFWIRGAREELLETLKLVNVLLINDTEAKMLAAESNLPRAAQKVLAMGPQALVIKHGEYGATIFFREGAFGLGHHPFRAPALPIEEVVDPTGAGDSFAGGFMGYIASQGEVSREVLKRALFYGGVMGSFAVERFGTETLQSLTREKIDARFQIFRELTHLE